MKKMTETNLWAAFAGESQAHMKYLVFAKKAEDEGKPNVARLFRAISFAEQVHAANHLKTLDEVGNTTENLQAAIDGENFEVDEMYPAYDAVAKLQEEKGAVGRKRKRCSARQGVYLSRLRIHGRRRGAG
jgi:rubrerythrin